MLKTTTSRTAFTKNNNIQNNIHQKQQYSEKQHNIHVTFRAFKLQGHLRFNTTELNYKNVASHITLSLSWNYPVYILTIYRICFLQKVISLFLVFDI